MNKELFTYLRSFSSAPFEVDRLIVSTFLYSRELHKTENEFLQQYVIHSEDEDNKWLQEFMAICQFSDIEELIQVFEFVISPEEKVVSGAVYTPKSIREYIFEQCISHTNDLENIKVYDPACGCGGFLYTAAKVIHDQTGRDYQAIFAENIYGLDIQEYAVNRSMLLLTLLALSEGEIKDFEFNITCGNALNFQWSEYNDTIEGFDIIVGNPPYVCSRNVDEESKKHILNWKVSESGHPDLYIPFFQIGVEALRPNGILGFITMNTFFKSVNGRALREYFEAESLALKILDFGGNQVFQSKSTYTCICIIQRKESKELEYVLGNKDSLARQIVFQRIPYTNLNHRNGWNLQHHDLLKQITDTGEAFGDLYRTRNGIATLKNRIFIFRETLEDDEYYYLQNGATYPIEKGICKEIINPNKLTRAKSIKQLKQRAIFPYSFDKSGDPELMAQEELEEQFPKAFKYLEAKKSALATRDKGKGNYENWYAYGRNQSLEKYSKKLFFPHITPHVPNYVISRDENLLFYNGLAVVSDDEQELKFLQKLMSSNLFWFYIVNSSKPYGSGYYSLSRNYIKSFGVYDFSKAEQDYIVEEGDSDELNKYIESKYKIRIPN